MNLDEFQRLKAEVYSAESREEALNLSGLLLAKVDENLRQKVNAKTERATECRMFALAASIHCELLQACGQAVAAYYTAVTSLLMLDIAGQGSEDSRLTEVCGLTFIALSAFGELAAQMPHDEFTDEHVPVLFSLWASRLYYYYQIADKSQQPELPHLICNAHRVLQQMIAEGIIQSPNVMLGEQPAGPQSSAVLADILGHSQALFNFRF